MADKQTLTHFDIESARVVLKTYFANDSANRHTFNTICDQARDYAAARQEIAATNSENEILREQNFTMNKTIAEQRQEIADMNLEIEEWQGTVAAKDQEIAELREDKERFDWWFSANLSEFWCALPADAPLKTPDDWRKKIDSFRALKGK